MTDAPLPADDVLVAYVALLQRLTTPEQAAALRHLLTSIVSRTRSGAQIAMLNGCEWNDRIKHDGHRRDPAHVVKLAVLDGTVHTLMYVAAEVEALLYGRPHGSADLRPFHIAPEWRESPPITDAEKATR
jgi:hypothetical protein